MDGKAPETCAECGFDSRAWRRRDAATLLDEYGYWWRLATTGLSPSDLNRRHAPGVWSALEYGFHTALVLAVNRAGIELIREQDDRLLPDPPMGGTDEGDPLELDPEMVAAELEREGRALAGLAEAAGAWDNTGRLASGARLQAEAVLFHAVHDATHHQMDVGRGLAALRTGTPAAQGQVAQINVSDGGVPKRPVSEAAIGWRGLEGDRQANRKHHGRPFQAVCLWSTEVIGGLASAGHPIAAGSAGENLTVTGVDWPSLRPGCRMAVGTTLLELSFPAIPCHHQKQWFSDGDFSRIHHDQNPGAARWYAWVRRPGVVRAGDALIVQPAAG